jgi:release factor glutamine methyltransferase
LSIDQIKILDIGTGSGIIPLVLKKYFPKAEITSIDYSQKALETAKKNADFHQLEVNFIHSDYLNFDLNENFDIIISNPPYIGIDEEQEIADSVKEFEPTMALFSPTSDALIFYRKIANDAKKHLNENGLLFLEINQKLGSETLELYLNDFKEAQLIKDLSENDRFIFGRK